MPTATQALQTVEIANASAWAVYQRNVHRLSLAAICALAAMEPIRRDDGSYAFEGGLGRPLAKSTLHRWLSEARDQFRDEYIRRPLIDMVQEEDDRLEHLAAESAQVLRMSEPGSPKWQAAYDRHLRTLESRRKLLGLDQPVRVEVTADVTTHDDPASAKLAEAMAEAKARRDQLMAEVTGDADG